MSITRSPQPSTGHRLVVVLLLMAVAPGLLACGDGRKRPAGPRGGDALPTRSLDEREPDAAVPTPDAGQVLVDLSGETLCTYTDEDTMAFPASTGATAVSLARSGSSMALAYHDDRGERGLRLLSLSGAARPGERDEGSQGSSGVRIVAIEDGFALSYLRGGELHVERVDLAGAVVERAVRLEDVPAGGTTSMLAAGGSIYLSLRGDGGLSLAQYPHDDPAAVSHRPPPVASGAVQHAAFVRLEDAVWLAWSSDGTLSMRELEGGEPVVLAEGVSGAFDIAAGEQSGAVAYGYRVDEAELVRYRPFTLGGEARFEARAVQHPPAVLRDVAIVPFGKGYALSYRSLTSRDFPYDAIRIAFMTATGEIVYEGEVSPTSRAGGATDLVASEDGHVVLAWSDTDDNHVHLQRLDCPVALRLCNAEMIEQ